MLFNSHIFLFLFLPVTLLGWFIINRGGKYWLADWFLIVMSFIFYGYYNWYYVLVLACSICVNWLLVQLMCRLVTYKKAVMVLGILFNLSVIFVFKYFDFFIENVNFIFAKEYRTFNIMLPLGISFYTFQQISFLVDSYKGYTAGYKFREYALFVVFFPQLIAGPITLHKEIIPQFQDVKKRVLSHDNFARGIYIFSIGLAKKVLLADVFAKAVSFGYAHIETLSSLDAIIVSVAYTIEIYLDFSGYSDMAIGLADMFNINMPINFDSPYKATSIIEFWKRWHMTLTRFLREYIYFPLGGGKKGRVRTYVNIMIVFLVSGIWHGANWTFVVWGLLHGIAQCLNRLFKKSWEKINVIIKWGLTFIFVDVTWVFFRAECLQDAVKFCGRIFKVNANSINVELMNCFQRVEFTTLQRICSPWRTLVKSFPATYMLIYFIIAAFVLTKGEANRVSDVLSIRKAMICIAILVGSTIAMTGVSTFIYFNF